VNGGFESGTSQWQEMPSSNLIAYANGQLSPTDTAYAGTHYGATNTSAPGGGIFENVTGLSINRGDTICGNAELRSELNETGANGQFTIWLLGGGPNAGSSAAYANLGNGTAWTLFSTCITATAAYSTVRIQFYPTPNSPTVDIDAVDVHDDLGLSQNLSQNGGFETGTSPWLAFPDSNIVSYANGQLSPTDTAYAGTHYGATNTTEAGGGIYEDILGLVIDPGDTLCVNAYLRSELAETGANGSVALAMLGGSFTETAKTPYANLGNGSVWKPYSTCLTATTAHATLQIEFLPTPNSPTLDIDAVALNESLDAEATLAQNGGFESGVAPWQKGPGSNLASYANGQIGPSDTAYAGTYYGATNTSASGGGIFEDLTGLTIVPGQSFCATAELRNELSETGANGTFTIWLLGGTANENGHVPYAGLGNGSTWDQYTTCVTAAADESTVRVQFYPAPNSPTLDIDQVEADQVLGSAPSSGCTATDSCTPQTFADTLLAESGVNAPITPANEFALETWALAEGGGAGCPGQPADQPPWQNSSGPAGNPLNTTQTEPGSTKWNSVGVQIYADGDGETCWYWGILATTQTITGAFGNYGPIIAALQDPATSDYTQCVQVAEAVGNSEWGTGNFSADC
jgi:hypothetical protein